MPWNLTIDDTSPWLLYDGNYFAHTGWKQWYSGTGYVDGAPTREAAEGNSLHVRNSTGFVSLTFNGTGVQLYGSSNASYAVQLDSQNQGSRLQGNDGELFSTQGLDAAEEHNITYQCHSSEDSQLCGFDRVVLFNEEYDGLDWTVVSNRDLDRLMYSGTWTVDHWDGVPSATTRQTFSWSNSPFASVSMKFTGAQAVAVYGSTTFEHGIYYITLNGQKVNRDAFSWRLLGDTLKYFRDGLDENEEYTITVGPDQSARFALNSMRLLGSSVSILSSADAKTSTSSKTTSSPLDSTSTSPNTTSTGPDKPSPRTNIGIIVGPVAGGLALLCIAVGLLVYRKFRRERREKQRLPTLVSTRDMARRHGVDPYIMQTSAGIMLKGSGALVSPASDDVPPPSYQEECLRDSDFGGKR
ncbi:uncharacterized protein SCHCODRAFT_02547704 [Schizophyllum commune H4-8]|uniref:Transmembrane protein n=1 Tax=Schizophyllum commune (strain H4-8 / FGSC 9210) TaxID=578458 RepID=D8Q8V6_SCHCM|nr:uncharacterized protein SCHCODRAFT_02547704 [Schizophyllum commune H4-8]KAI5890657.1 hypothetical protein SCHCODRAFT_02547704 [Schizophyllum commune H4-8]